jgi:predicted dehydrogenase
MIPFRREVPFVKMTRRSVFAAGSALLGRTALGRAQSKAPSDKLNIAGVGVGGMGREYLQACPSENIVALADVDEAYAAHTFRLFPAAKVYRDYRVMLEKEKSIDAVVIGTPDHTHAVVAMAAMNQGKHVYCAKPLTRTVQELRTVVRTAREHKVATQMSAQSCASEEACQTEEWIKAGVIGKVRTVHVWSDRPVWPQGMQRPEGGVPVPKTLDWDLWLGPAAARPWNPVYAPFVWRGWCDFGTGALGDMACHAFHVVFRALGLQHPLSVSASRARVIESSLVFEGDEPHLKPRVAQTPDSFPVASVVTWDFPGGVRMIWYDGGIKPPHPQGLPPTESLGSSGVIYEGDSGVLLSGFTGGPRVLGREITPPPRTVKRSIGHYDEWIAACKGGPPANCEFGFAGLVTETALLGVIAERTGRYLEWDPQAMRFTNDPDACKLLSEPYRSGWAL